MDLSRFLPKILFKTKSLKARKQRWLKVLANPYVFRAINGSVRRRFFTLKEAAFTTMQVRFLRTFVKTYFKSRRQKGPFKRHLKRNYFLRQKVWRRRLKKKKARKILRRKISLAKKGVKKYAKYRFVKLKYRNFKESKTPNKPLPRAPHKRPFRLSKKKRTELLLKAQWNRKRKLRILRRKKRELQTGRKIIVVPYRKLFRKVRKLTPTRKKKRYVKLLLLALRRLDLRKFLVPNRLRRFRFFWVSKTIFKVLRLFLRKRKLLKKLRSYPFRARKLGHVRVTFSRTINNLYGTINLQRSGKLLAVFSAGSVGFKGTRKMTPVAAEKIGAAVCQYLRRKKLLKGVNFVLKLPSYQKFTKSFVYGFTNYKFRRLSLVIPKKFKKRRWVYRKVALPVKNVLYHLPTPHNGIRLPKPRRV